MNAEFDKRLPVLVAGGVEFILIGGVAAIVHGSSRLTYRAQARCGPSQRLGVVGRTPALAGETKIMNHLLRRKQMVEPIRWSCPPTHSPRRWHLVSLSGLVCAWLSPVTMLCAAEPIRVEANRMVEITFTAKKNYEDPFNQVVLNATFKDPTGQLVRVPAFWAGGNTWKVRYASPRPGTHRYRSEGGAGLHGLEGDIEIVPYHGETPLFRHGPIRVARERRHFEYGDGKRFFWLGDTWWMGLCHRLEWPDEFKTLTADRVTKGFNVVQIVAGLYPDMPPFDPRGANEAGFPWETNYTRIRPEYFDAADRRLEHLVDAGITPCVVGAWGYFMPWMGVDKAKQHWRYLIARYAALPVVWCAAGEANLPYYLTKGFPFDDRQQVKEWTQVMRHIRETDPFHRPLSIHPTGLGRLSARGAVEDEALLDFDMLQTGHGLREVLAPTVNTVRASYTAKPVMPVINSEVCYEMLGDNIPAEIPRLMFWASVLSGAAGHTYGANGIWQCNRPGEPHGKSPHGRSYGKIPWKGAMKLPGCGQLGGGKQFLGSFGLLPFEPQPGAATWKESTDSPAWGQWIWFPEGDPKRDAPAEARFFRRAFELPADASIKRAPLFVSADDKFTVWINGKEIGSSADGKNPKRFEISKLLKPGRNVLAVRAENLPAAVKENPAGLIAGLTVEMESEASKRVASDGAWRASKTADGDWTTVEFDDSAWTGAVVAAEYGDGPWGKIGTEGGSIVPFVAGVSDGIRVVYVPEPRPITVHLRAKAKYQVIRFDPVTGKRARPSEAQTDERGLLDFPAPESGHDWVLALERVGP